MKLLFENWREYLKEAHGVQTTWDDVHIEDVWKIIGRSCKKGRECKTFEPSVLKSKLKHKPSVTLDPERVKGASLAYPLIVVVDRDTGEYQYIMDGNHRFAQAIQLELEEKQLDAEIQVKELYTDEYNQLFGGAE